MESQATPAVETSFDHFSDKLGLEGSEVSVARLAWDSALCAVKHALKESIVQGSISTWQDVPAVVSKCHSFKS